MDLSKRKWKPVFRLHSGKLYTGYQNPWNSSKIYKEVDEKHKSYIMRLKVVDVTRGRSAADFIFEDEDGDQYDMKLGSTLKLLQGLTSGEIKPESDGFLTLEIVQVKKGSNYAIEIV